MNDQEIEQALHYLTGLWPFPTLTDDEAAALRIGLRPYGKLDLKAAVSDLSQNTQRDQAFRPSPSHIIAALRGVRSRGRAVDECRALHARPPASKAQNLAGVQRARERLASCRPISQVIVEGSRYADEDDDPEF